MNSFNEQEKSLKRCLKRKMAITVATVVAFAITGEISFAGTVINEGKVTQGGGESSTALGSASYALDYGSFATGGGILDKDFDNLLKAENYEEILKGEYGKAFTDEDKRKLNDLSGEGKKNFTILKVAKYRSSTGYSNGSFAFGGIAFGKNSRAMGQGTIAEGNYSTAMGYKSKASGKGSLAIGGYSKIELSKETEITEAAESGIYIEEAILKEYEGGQANTDGSIALGTGTVAGTLRLDSRGDSVIINAVTEDKRDDFMKMVEKKQ